MDPLTHSLAGGALGATPLGRVAKTAPILLIVGANLPDIDALAYLQGEDVSLDVRRGWTHGIVAMIVLPLLLWGLFYAFERWRGREPAPDRLFYVAVLAVWSHPLLDWLNTYGVRLLYPFDGRWFYGDALYIVDPWMWLLLGAATFLVFARRKRAVTAWTTVAAMASVVVGFGIDSTVAKAVWFSGLGLLALLRLVDPKLGDVHLFHRSPPAEKAAIACCGAALVYVLAMVGSSFLGERIAARAVAQGIDGEPPRMVRGVMAGPKPIDPTVRDILVATPEGYRTGTLSWLDGGRIDWSPEPISTLVPPADRGAFVEALRDESVAGFVNWQRFPFAEMIRDDSGHVTTVWLIDARYQRTRAASFGSARVDLEPVNPAPRPPTPTPTAEP
jgi:inner membrane protein